jgi:hypothetical protein
MLCNSRFRPETNFYGSRAASNFAREARGASIAQEVRPGSFGRCWRETEAKVHALQEQAKHAAAGSKKRIAAIRADYTERKAKLEQAACWRGKCSSLEHGSAGARANAEPMLRQPRHIHFDGQHASRQGLAAKLCAVRNLRAVVMYSVLSSGPPKQAQVGLVTGSSITRSTSPDGA